MGLLCSCSDAAIPTITLADCPLTIGQIQKIIFQRVYSTNTTKNKFTISSTDPNAKATWDTVLAAADGTKAQLTPYLNNPEQEAGEKTEFGGGNATLGGIPIVVGSEPSTFAAQIFRYKQNTIEELKQLTCDTVGVYFIDEYNQIIGLADDVGTPTEFYPIPVEQVFIGDVKLGRKDEPNMNAMSFYLNPNWSNKLHVVTPVSGFYPLTDLNNTGT